MQNGIKKVNATFIVASSADKNVERVQNAGHLLPCCLACGQPETLVWVHGHGQCAYCHVNIMPCCDGATCELG